MHQSNIITLISTNTIKNMTTKHQLFNLENAHAFLVQAAKLAHIDKDRHAEKISKLIDSLEEILEQENFHLAEDSSKESWK